MYSFDVFDTLITRTVAVPRGIFSLIKEHLNEEKEKSGLNDYIIDNFVELRIHSEELARKANSFLHKEEVSLHEIYKAMSLCGCLNEDQISNLCRLEEEIEIANAVPLPDNIQWIKELLTQGERVVLISDMYLPRETIWRMLIKADDIFRGIPLYVSSEYVVRKTTGNLYRKVQALEQVNFDNWTHVGDNIHQDIEVPYWLGIKVKLSPKVMLSEFERKLLLNDKEDIRLQLMIGTALRIERKHTGNLPSDLMNIGKTACIDAYSIGCRYAGPVLYSYAEWIANQAIEKGIKRLYFIARDGYIIKKIVDMILLNRRKDIRTSYIYGSRKAWRMPSLSEDYYNLYQLILWSHTYRIHTLDDLAEVLHISLQELYKYLPGTYIKDQKNRTISNMELEFIAQSLSVDKRFQRFHLQKLAYERKLVLEYLKQEVDISDSHFAFVDVAGSGMTQGCLRQLLKERYKEPIRTFFFKVDRVNLIEDSITDTFLPSFLQNNVAIEMLCRAPHGQTKGYSAKKGKIVPVIEGLETERLIEHGFYDYENGIMDFTELMCKTSEKCDKRIGSLKNVLLYLQHIAQEPTKELLEFFASMPSSETGREGVVMEYAPKLTEQDMKEIFFKRVDEPISLFYQGTDLKYSVMRATDEEKALMEQYKKERDSTLGRLYRQEAERELKEQCKNFGRAAFYPVRLLEERVIVYGAGKFGQDLYHRLKSDKEHEVALWVDKRAPEFQRKGMGEVRDISEIIHLPDVQIVIAVMAEDMAQKIRNELQQMGTEDERIVWICPCDHPNPTGDWKEYRRW